MILMSSVHLRALAALTARRQVGTNAQGACAFQFVGHADATIQPITCDGAKHTYPVSALVSDVPFRPGAGAVRVTAQAQGISTSFQFVGQQGSAVTAITVK